MLIEQNHTEHHYRYDAAGRQVSDFVDNIPSGIDTTVQALVTQYDALDRPTAFLSEGPPASNQPFVVLNEVTRVYNGFGQVTDEYQSNSGAVTGTSPDVHYTYADANNGSRLVSVQYPNGGRTVNYTYSPGIDADTSRVSAVGDNVVGAIESYQYLGLGTVVDRSLAEPGLDQSYMSAAASGDSGDRYKGLDRFGRVLDQNWMQGTSSLEHIQYAYDADSNLLYANNLLAPTQSELYHNQGSSANDFNNSYDLLNRISSFQRGTLSASVSGGTLDTAATNTGSNQAWTYDLTGNWKVFINGTARYDNYFSNNVLTGTASQSGDSTDGGGDQTVEAIQASAGTTASAADVTQRHATYDAWGRMVSSGYNTGQVSGWATYSYDALGRPIVETGAYPQSQTLDLYYSLGGQVIQEVLPPGGGRPATVLRENVFSPADGRIVMSEIVNDGQPQNRLRQYPVYDGKGNITALVDHEQLSGQSAPSWQVVERYEYTPSGSVTFLDNNWNPSSTPGMSTRGWKYYFQGMRYNFGDGLYHLGGKAYDPFFGRWMQPSMDALSGGQNPYTDRVYNPHMEAYHDPAWVHYTSQTFAWIGTAALTIASLGTYSLAEGAIAFSLRQGLINTARVAAAGGMIGAIDAGLGGDNVLQGAYSGSKFAMALTGGLNLLPRTLAWGLGLGVNIGLTGYGSYQSFTDPAHDRTLQGLFRIGTGVYFGIQQLGYELNLGGGYNPEADGSYVLGMGRIFRPRYIPPAETVQAYADAVNSNRPFTWADIDITLTQSQRAAVKAQAVAQGLIATIPVDPVTRYANFDSVAIRNEQLPEDLWLKSDDAQFKYLNELIGGQPEGTTWHHHQTPGRMQLVSMGIHNVTNHVGGRTIWGGGNGAR